MNNTELKGSWNERKDKLKNKLTALTNDELLLEGDKKEEMYSKLQIKLGKTKEELDNIIYGL